MSEDSVIPDLEKVQKQKLISDAAKELLRRNSACSNLIDFIKFTFPKYVVEPAHRLMASKLDAVVKGDIRRLMIFAPPRHGKQLAHSTQVPTPQGFKNHGDLKPGDFVFGRDGKPAKVLAISEETLATREVEFSDHSVIKCHPKHEWVVFDYLNCNRKERIYETDEMMSMGVRSGPRKRGFGSYFKIDANVCVEYLEKELPIHPYVLGAWLGDGSSGGGAIYHAAADDQVVKKIESIGFPITGLEIHSTTGVHKTRFRSLTKVLRSVGLLNNKRIPEEYLYSSIQQRLELLAGLIDTDGSVSCGKRTGLVNTNKGLIDSFIQLARSLGCKVGMYKCEPCLSSSGIQGRKVVYYAGFFIPSIDIPTAIPRKKCIFGKAKIHKRSIVSITPCEPELGRCIQVEGGVYLVGETFIPTHNSELTSIRLPAYWLGRRPDESVMICSYGSSLADEKSGMSRDVMETNEYKLLFKGLTTRKDSRSVSNWKINFGRAAVVAAGVSGPITGKGASLAIVDDPFKDWEEAQSERIRETCWNWYRSTFLTRLEEKGAIVIIQTRWHDDDLAGRLLKEQPGEWEILRLPALAETQEERDLNNDFLGLPLGESDPLDRLPGEPLCPERISLDTLLMLQRQTGASTWSSLYQGVPRPSEGNRFKRDWFKEEFKVPYEAKRVRAWDKAATEREGDFSVGLLMAMHNGIFYVEDMVRGQWSAGERDKKMKEIAEQDSLRYKNTVAIWVEQEGGSGGKESAQNSVKLLAGFPVYTERSSGKKEVRAEPFAAQAEAGNTKMLKALWNKDFINEVCSFPNGKHDDIVDAASMAFNKLALTNNVQATLKVFALRPGNNSFAPKKGKNEFRIAVCNKYNLESMACDAEALLVSIWDPDSVVTIPSHRFENLLDKIDLCFADLDPNSNECQKWDELIQPWNKKPEELIFTKDQGKKLWSFLTKKREVNPRTFVIVDNGGNDRRAISLAMGICDSLYLERDKTLYRLEEPEVKQIGKAPNGHVFSITRSSRRLVIT